MPRRALVTGCNGFVGKHLTRYLKECGEEVVGIDLQPHPWAEWLAYSFLDIADHGMLLDFIEKHEVKDIYHLAAVANPRAAEEDPLAALRTNVSGSASIYEACRTHGDMRVLAVGTMEQYRKANGPELLFHEDSPLEASTIYGVTKVCSELVGRGYVQHYGCRIVFTRTFNHTGPGQAPVYVLSDFAKQCAEISAGLKEPVIRVGNIDVSRDFLDVADVTRAYRMLMDKGMPGSVYNVCASECYPLRELLDTLVSFAGKQKIRIAVEANRVRADEPARIRGDSRRLREQTGWTPTVSIQETLRRLYDYWAEELSS